MSTIITTSLTSADDDELWDHRRGLLRLPKMLALATTNAWTADGNDGNQCCYCDQARSLLPLNGI
ncbi:hypothetical protein SCLCIDRAFT_1220210 [Scleroderma citrinum Foug A]|uniref:Uncharacterized protein n=1 Tax=Scleroderma citrinum Foug A TaxID=1036808 RepID=A0A0C2Z403_9AGAM|nr:hypothetical protein SCLCIDRAFT_1220210 [Scleroderma citrinum Foug A]